MSYLKYAWKNILLIFFISFILEIGLFNFRHWESRLFHPLEYSVHLSNGLQPIDEKKFLVTDGTNAFIELLDIEGEVKNIYIDILSDSDVIPVQIEGTDSANAMYLKLPATELVKCVPESYYKRVHFIGVTNKVKINILDSENQVLTIRSLGINCQRPFEFRILRFVLLNIIIAALHVFHPKSGIYDIALEGVFQKKHIYRITILAALLSLGILSLGIGWTFLNRNWQETGWLAELQYNYLAESLLKGKVYLDFEPPATLAKISNPYDTELRNYVLREANESIIMDLAYYQGHYYSYFGIVPVLLFYIPYYLLTGNQLCTGYIIIASSILFLVSTFWFVKVLIERYFNGVSVGVYILLSGTLYIASEVLYFLQMPTLYSLPILLGITFDLLGLTCWIKAKTEVGGVKKRWLLLGAILIALVMGCRPQLAIVVLLAFPIFWTEIRNKLFFSIKGLGNTLAVIMPFLVIGTGIMLYNYARFGNPLDFGATYNLTGFDMTHRGFVFERFWVGFFEYLFQPFVILPRFPYIYSVANMMNLVSDYQGQLINEPLMAGYFSYNFIGILLLLLFRLKDRIKKHKLYGILIGMLSIAFIIIAVDIQMVGLTLRYLSDFSMFLTIPLIIVILTMDECFNEKYQELKRYWHTTLVILVAVCFIMNIWSLFGIGRLNELRYCSPYIYYGVKYMFCLR